MANLVPLNDYVILEPVKAETMTASGIVIPDTASKEKSKKGKVISVGPGKNVEGKLVPLEGVKIGDIAYFREYSQTEFKVEGKDYYVVSFDALIALEK
jgi:chaperonin GroES